MTGQEGFFLSVISGTFKNSMSPVAMYIIDRMTEIPGKAPPATYSCPASWSRCPRASPAEPRPGKT